MTDFEKFVLAMARKELALIQLRKDMSQNPGVSPRPDIAKELHSAMVAVQTTAEALLATDNSK
jgi:hypothetical protein